MIKFYKDTKILIYFIILMIIQPFFFVLMAKLFFPSLI
jgi:hypothetical protein